MDVRISLECSLSKKTVAVNNYINHCAHANFFSLFFVSLWTSAPLKIIRIQQHPRRFWKSDTRPIHFSWFQLQLQLNPDIGEQVLLFFCYPITCYLLCPIKRYSLAPTRAGCKCFLLITYLEAATDNGWETKKSANRKKIKQRHLHQIV